QLGPDGQPLPPRPRRERKPMGPDANGMGPDGKPWDPARRAQRQAERETAGPASQGNGAPPMNSGDAGPVEARSPEQVDAPKE
nr:hypothetical protein [Myxococcota bacterium]